MRSLMVDLYTSLLLSCPLINFAHALSRNEATLSSRDVASTFDVPPNGIICDTPSERAHNITADEITRAINYGKQLSFTFPQYSSTRQSTNNLGYPKPFKSDMLSKDAAGNRYSVNMPQICGKQPDGLQAFYVGSDGDMSASNPNLVLYQVIWVYERMDHENSENNAGNPDVADVRFCALLTNSDADEAERPGGYHQCNANP